MHNVLASVQFFDNTKMLELFFKRYGGNEKAEKRTVTMVWRKQCLLRKLRGHETCLSCVNSARSDVAGSLGFEAN